MTAEELFELPDDGLRHELVEGELHTMTPVGGKPRMGGPRALEARPFDHVERAGLGRAYAAETRFVLHREGPGHGSGSRRRVRRGGPGAVETRGFAELAPDLVVEVVSPSDRASEVASNAEAWLDAGVRLVWVVDPQARLAAVHRPGGLAPCCGRTECSTARTCCRASGCRCRRSSGDQSRSKTECSS